MRSDLSLMSVPEILQVQRQLHSLMTAIRAGLAVEMMILVCKPTLAFAANVPAKHGDAAAGLQQSTTVFCSAEERGLYHFLMSSLYR